MGEGKGKCPSNRRCSDTCCPSPALPRGRPQSPRGARPKLPELSTAASWFPQFWGGAGDRGVPGQGQVGTPRREPRSPGRAVPVSPAPPPAAGSPDPREPGPGARRAHRGRRAYLPPWREPAAGCGLRAGALCPEPPAAVGPRSAFAAGSGFLVPARGRLIIDRLHRPRLRQQVAPRAPRRWRRPRRCGPAGKQGRGGDFQQSCS